MASASCRKFHCPRCGYTVPDESGSSLVRLLRRFFGARFSGDVAPGGQTGPSEPAAQNESGARTGPLSQLGPGRSVTVVRIEGDDLLHSRLAAQGLAPGVALTLVQRFPGFVLEIGETTLAVERRVADVVVVREVPSSRRPTIA
jgi:Fe2+ transport system protein FeoA